MAANNKQSATNLAQKIKQLEAQVAQARQQANAAIRQYQIERQAFLKWLDEADTDYLVKRTAKMNEIELLRQEMAKLRMQHDKELKKCRKAWAKTFGY